MKRYKNISNRHLQFVEAGVELAPGQEVSVADAAAKSDPGFQMCLDRGLIDDLASPKQNKAEGKSAVSGKKGSSKSDLFEPDATKKTEEPAPDKKDS